MRLSKYFYILLIMRNKIEAVFPMMKYEKWRFGGRVVITSGWDRGKISYQIVK